MDDEKRAEEAETAEQDEVEAKELTDDELEQAAGGDPGYTHPDIPDVWPGG